MTVPATVHQHPSRYSVFGAVGHVLKFCLLGLCCGGTVHRLWAVVNTGVACVHMSCESSSRRFLFPCAIPLRSSCCRREGNTYDNLQPFLSDAHTLRVFNARWLRPPRENKPGERCMASLLLFFLLMGYDNIKGHQRGKSSL